MGVVLQWMYLYLFNHFDGIYGGKQWMEKELSNSYAHWPNDTNLYTFTHSTIHCLCLSLAARLPFGFGPHFSSLSLGRTYIPICTLAHTFCRHTTSIVESLPASRNDILFDGTQKGLNTDGKINRLLAIIPDARTDCTRGGLTFSLDSETVCSGNLRV